MTTTTNSTAGAAFTVTMTSVRAVGDCELRIFSPHPWTRYVLERAAMSVAFVDEVHTDGDESVLRFGTKAERDAVQDYFRARGFVEAPATEPR